MKPTIEWAFHDCSSTGGGCTSSNFVPSRDSKSVLFAVYKIIDLSA